MKTLLDLTWLELRKNKYVEEDVVSVQSLDGLYNCTWEDFKRMADVPFNSDYKPRRELLSTLVIHLSDGSWMQSTSAEFNGSVLEYWYLNKKPKLALFDCIEMDKVIDSLSVIDSICDNEDEV